ncbi:MAG: PQQ-like beta-propeller repeat protein, partial [bacterium]|nr:PQQ-like beta-propeller repeat protein [bacterium]
LSNPPKGKKETPAQTDKRKKDQEKIKSEQKANNIEIKRLQKDAGACVGWNVKCPVAYEIILAGEMIFLGGDSNVYAMSARGGKQLWKAPVDGKAHGLAVANGRLYVSTTKGKIHCFATAKPKAKDKPADGL